MKAKISLLVLVVALTGSAVNADESRNPVKKTPDLVLTGASVTYLKDLDTLVFEQQVQGSAGRTKPTAIGKLDGAPVIGYVFPTTLKSTEVGFSATDGIVALAVTSHPDFDDSPLWDENNDGVYDNDGLVYHPHWVVLVEDQRVAGGLSVKEFHKTEAVVVPPTAPKMPMFMDSPGYGVVTAGNTLKVIVPVQRVNRKTDFKFDAVTAYMEVAAPGANHAGNHAKPMLGVYEVFSVLSGTLTLPFSVNVK